MYLYVKILTQIRADIISLVIINHNPLYSLVTWLALEHTQMASISMTDMMAGMAQNTRRNSSATRSTQPWNREA